MDDLQTWQKMILNSSYGKLDATYKSIKDMQRNIDIQDAIVQMHELYSETEIKQIVEALRPTPKKPNTLTRSAITKAIEDAILIGVKAGPDEVDRILQAKEQLIKDLLG